MSSTETAFHGKWPTGYYISHTPATYETQPYTKTSIGQYKFADNEYVINQVSVNTPSQLHMFKCETQMNINSVVRMHSIELYLDTHWMDEQKAVFRWIKTYGGWVKQLEANKFISSVCFQLFSKYRCRTCACVGFLWISRHNYTSGSHFVEIASS